MADGLPPNPDADADEPPPQQPNTPTEPPPLEVIRVKGKNKPVRIFTLLGDVNMKESAAFENIKLLHNEMLKAWRAGEFAKVIKLAKECEALKFSGLETAYGFYIERAEKLLKDPPKDWDGIYDAKSK